MAVTDDHTLAAITDRGRTLLPLIVRLATPSHAGWDATFPRRQAMMWCST